MSEENEMTRQILYVCATLAFVALVGFGGCHLTNRVALEKGLCQDTVQGQQGLAWVPCAPK